MNVSKASQNKPVKYLHRLQDQALALHKLVAVAKLYRKDPAMTEGFKLKYDAIDFFAIKYLEIH
jgi:RIO-like serine/threonine protein kinase